MAIYKLGDIAKIKSGGDLPKIFSLNKTKENKFLVLGNGINKKSILGYSSNYQINKNNITISARGTIGYVQWIEKKFTPCIRLIVILGNKNIVLKKYLYYKLLRFKFPYTGAVQKQLTKPMVSKININIPNLKTQKQIIDIIEPYEKLFLSYSQCVRIDNISNTKKDIKNLIDIIEPIEKLELTIKKLSKVIGFITKNTFITFSEKNDYNFQKGLLPIKNKVGITPFLNVSAANNKINRYVINEPNIKIGDVTISLDGNTGLVNNALEGFNGYLFKVTSKKWKNYQIYYSLKNKINQKIIKLNEIGTTIKHSSKSKKEILHLEFLEDFLLKEMFNLEISIFKIVKKLKKLKKFLINLLIN